MNTLPDDPEFQALWGRAHRLSGLAKFHCHNALCVRSLSDEYALQVTDQLFEIVHELKELRCEAPVPVRGLASHYIYCVLGAHKRILEKIGEEEPVFFTQSLN